ncbi:MAG: amino acid ABC transporter permease [Acutalibacteraceae bacterium]|nr:amino acid ABC transporter permease [Clostridia bacterium]MEE1143808.1 amino acid ABC transporter permease [Acutalibacteraceae bacterium]
MEHSILDITSVLLQGFGKNCVIFFVTLVLAVPLGLVISFGSMSKFKPLAIITKLYVWIIRGTPLMLQLFVVFFVPGLIFDMPMRNRMVAALIAFVINYSAYFSEIYRGGIEGIPRGQREAGQVLGMTKSQIFFKVELLQVIKRIIPPMGNEIITLIKDTSLANVIAVMDITMTAKTFTNQGLIWPLFYSGLFYLAFCGILTLLFSWLEKKLNFFKN